MLSFSVITDDLTLSSKDQNIFCIVNCKEDYDNLKLACEPNLQKKNTLYEKASIEVEGKHFDLDILMGGDNMKFGNLCLGWVDLYVIIPVHGVESIKTRGTT
jgi:hypothetical protein